LLRDCNNFSRMTVNGADNERIYYLNIWHETVEAVLREISVKLTTKDTQTIEEELDKLSMVSLWKVKSEYAYKTQYVLDEKGFHFYKQKLKKVETLLRRCADERGMLIPDKSKPIDVIGEDLG